MADRTLTVKIIGDSRSLEQAFARSSKAGKNFQATILPVNNALGKLALAGGAAIGLRAVFDQMRQATAAASNLTEQVNKTDVVFRGSAQDIVRWSETTADAFGVSQRAALEAASGFGQILETSGLTAKSAADMSRRLVELAADIASFNNIDPTEALDKLRSGLAGEAEPLRRVGVLLSEARVKAEAYASGIAKSGSKLTEGQKVQARFNLILRDTATAQGDFARTSDSLANKQRILSAHVEELQARLGEDLIPVLSSLIDKFLEGEDAVRKFGAALDKLPGGTKFKLLDLFPDSGVTKERIDELKRQSQQLDAVARGGGLDFRMPGITVETGAAGGGIRPEQINRIFDARIGRELNRVADKTLAEQVGALNKIEAEITEEIARVKDVTRKLTLRDQLLDVQRQEAAVRQQRAANFLDNLQLGLDRAQMTRTFTDDLSALDALEQGIRAQIRQAGSTNELQRQLLSIEQQRASIAEQRRDAARQAAQAAAAARAEAQQLFIDTGSPVVPGVANLRKQLGSLSKAVEGTFLDTRETEGLFGRLRKVLAGGLGDVGRDIRQKIADILRDLRRQLDESDVGKTKTTSLNPDRILSGLGLSPDEIRRLRGRLAGFNSAGQQLAGRGSRIGAFGLPVATTGGVQVAVQAPDVFLDSQKVSRSVRRQNTIHARSNPKQRRGRRR